MRKSIIFGLAVLAMLSFAVMPAMAGQSCGDVSAKLGNADAKKACSGDAKTASHDCNYEGKCETISFSVKGMTCAGCENGLTTALTGTDGVIKVMKVSHKENLAVLCFDPTKTKTESLTKLIASKGYETSIIPAVATNANAVQAGAKAGCSTMSKADCAKTCGAKAAATCDSKKKEEKAKTDGSL